MECILLLDNKMSMIRASQKGWNFSLKSEITRLNGLLGQAAKTPSSSMPPAKTAETSEDWLAKEIQKQG